ncbi:hypothetical protein CGLAUT_10685 [Corynebacterium glaucum]|nr:hypothetical protein [Corynebacterium glaucum]WJZ08595.1 hypothetical protein CGLAUT_10685 [Corynebacterium glaucum]
MENITTALENWKFVSSDAHLAGALLEILKSLAGAAENAHKLLGLL